jgi:O-antigen/teichoic acid export membrane protein
MAHVLVKNISVNVFGQVVNIVGQVGLLPLFLTSWNVGLYGEWLVLLALPTYFSAMADAGLTQVSANDMTIKFAQDRQSDVVEVFQSAWLFVSILSLLVVGAILGATMLLGVSPLLGLSIMSDSEASRVLACTLAMFFIGFQNDIVQAALRAIGRFAEGNFTAYLIALLEAVAVAAALFMGASPTIVVALMLTGRLAALAVAAILLRHFAPWLHHGAARASRKEIRRLLVPSLAILGIPAGNAAMLQGFIVILNHTVGPAAVVLFSTTRTMTRFTLQAVSVFSRSSWPEISRLYGAGRSDSLGAFLTHGTQLAAILAIGFAIVLIGGAPLIFKIWTVGRVEADRVLVTILMVAAATISFRAFPDTLIFATNRHIGYSGWYVLVCLAATAACYPISLNFGVIGAANVVAAAEIALLAISMTRALQQIGQGLVPIRRLFTTPLPIKRLFSK